MRASLRDYNIVIDVTEHQILYALNYHPNTIDEFKAKLPSYSTINTDLQKGKEREGEKHFSCNQYLLNNTHLTRHYRKEIAYFLGVFLEKSMHFLFFR